MKPKLSGPQQRKHCATKQKPARVFLRKGLTPIAELEKKYEELCRLRELVQIAESRQRMLLRLSDDACH
jgi:hypothetical protein